MKNVLIALLIAVNLFLGFGLVTLAYEPTPAQAQQALLPQEYLIIPVNTGTNSLLCVLNSQRRVLLVCQINGRNLAPQPPIDLKNQFEQQ